jgi:hypothetical protein
LRCNRAKLLLDLCAKAIEGSVDWTPACFPCDFGDENSRNGGDSAPHVPRSVVQERAGFGLTTGLGLTKGVGSAALRCLHWRHDRHDRYRASYQLAGCRCLTVPLATGNGSPVRHPVLSHGRASGPFPVPSRPKRRSWHDRYDWPFP